MDLGCDHGVDGGLETDEVADVGKYTKQSESQVENSIGFWGDRTRYAKANLNVRERVR